MKNERQGKLMLGIIFIFLASSVYAGDKDLLKEAKEYFKPIPSTPPLLKDNPINPAKVKLGKMLYFDPRLSASQLISCNSCHNLSLGGIDLQETSTGHLWQRGSRNAPTVLNSVFNIAQFWDGRAKDLEKQAKGPVQASVEMNNTPERVITTLKSIPEYVVLFKKAFPGEKNPLTFDNVAKAIEAFEATLLTPDSRFDQFLKGDKKALSKKEKQGLAIFMSKGCAGCHSGVNIGGEMYAPFGVVKKPGADILPPEDKGRFKITKTDSDKYVFKVPSLRNVELTRPYFHSGKVWKLKDAVRIMGSAQLGIKLSEKEVKRIVAFLKTLTGKQLDITLPVLPQKNLWNLIPW